uniref:Scavenger receptor class F member 2 n=1 Tax=Magallana gigas TaxID=29159 RepID=A0A8W8NKE0_MAGGI
MNTPTVDMASSPSRTLMSRKTRHSLLMSQEFLQLKLMVNVTDKVKFKRQKKKIFYDRTTKDLSELEIGQPVRMRATTAQGKKWTYGTCVDNIGKRSYLDEDAESPVFMAPLVTFSVPSPVKTGHVTYKMENVWDVNLGDSTKCNHVTGQCEKGCDTGWTGSLCTKECDGGTFGYDCVNNCSGHCLNGSTCNKQSGACDRSCNPGYTYIDCSKKRIVLYQNVSSSTSWIIACTASLVVNCVLISGACLLCRGIYTKKVSISRDLLSRSKRSIYYTDTELAIKTGENSTYQELDLSREEIEYQNTAIR